MISGAAAQRHKKQSAQACPTCKVVRHHGGDRACMYRRAHAATHGSSTTRAEATPSSRRPKAAWSPCAYQKNPAGSDQWCVSSERATADMQRGLSEGGNRRAASGAGVGAGGARAAGEGSFTAVYVPSDTSHRDKSWSPSCSLSLSVCV